jgi:cyanate lyase
MDKSYETAFAEDCRKVADEKVTLEELKDQAQRLCTMVTTVLDAHLLQVQQDTLKLINRKTEYVSQTEDQMTRADDETCSRVQEQLNLYCGDMDSLIHDQQEYAVGLASAINIVKDIKKDIAAAADKDAVMACVKSIHEKTKFAYIFSNRTKEAKHE